LHGAPPIDRDLDLDEHEADEDDLDEDDTTFEELQYDLGLAQDVIGKTAHAVWDRLGDVGQDLADYVDNLRWQLPRLTRLRRLHDDTEISLGKTLAEQAAAIPERT